jgi:hypothetical protein
MRNWLAYVSIEIMWCLLVLGVIRLIELYANSIDAHERSPAPYCC